MKEFKKFLQKPSSRIVHRELSPSVGLRILEKEIELDRNISKQVVEDLIKLYTQIVEHYEAEENPRYLDFQEKLQRMLVRPQVLALFSDLSGRDSQDCPTVLSPRAKAGSPESVRKRLSKNLSQTLMSCPDLVLNSHSNVSKEAFNNLISDFKSQETDLEAKKELRKRRKQSRQASLCELPLLDISLESTSTKSSQNDLKEGLDRYEKMLEQVMPQNIQEKQWEIVQTRAKFEKELELGLQVQAEMQKEVERIAEEFDCERKHMISLMKKKL